jgi:hypothetical protein
MAQDINALNQEIANLRRQLGDKPLTPFDSKDLDKALLTVKALRQELREASSDLDYINKSFKDSVNEMSRQNIYLNTAKKSLNGIADISRKVADYRRGENVLSEKQLSTLKDQARVKFEELKLSIRSGQLDQNNLRDAQAALDEQEAFNKVLDRTIELQEKVNKDIGLMGSGLEGVGKLLEKMGFAGIAKPISEAIQKTKDARFQIELNKDAIESLNEEYQNTSAADVVRRKELRDQIGSLKSQNKELETQSNKYKNISSSLKEQLTFVNAFDFILTNIIKGFTKLNEAQVEFTRETGRNVSHFDTLNSSLISSADYIKTATALTQQFGFAADAIFSKDTIESATKLQVLMGMSAEEAGKAAALSKINSTGLEDQSQAILDQVGAYNKTNQSALNQKGILKDVYNTSQTIQLSLGGNTKKIADANIAARALGLSLKEVEGISDSLLNIESSIAAEFEAEVITGKQLNLEAARYYALQNDLEGVTKEIGNNQEILNVFAKGTRIEQEAIAKSIGLSKDQVSQMIFAQQLSQGITKEQAALNSGMKLEDLERLTVQESITKSMEKMGQALAGPLEMLASMLDNLMQFSGIITTVIGSFVILKGIQLTMLGIAQASAAYESLKLGYIAAQRGAALGYNGILLARQAILSGELAKAIGIAAAYAIANPFAALAGLVVAAGVGAVVYSQMKDGVIDPKKGPVVSGEFGTIQLNPKDSIVAGTNLMSNSKVGNNSSSTPQSSPLIDYDKMAAAISKVTVQSNLDGVNVSRGLQTPMGIATRKI